MNIEKAIQTQAIANLKSKAVINILHTAYHVRCKVSDTLKAYGLTPEQFNVLRILKGKHPEQMCVRDIAGRMIERSSNVPRIIDRLEVKKLVKRGTSTMIKEKQSLHLRKLV